MPHETDRPISESFLFLICTVCGIGLAGCTLFQSSKTRQQRVYERYVQKSQGELAERSAAIRRAQAEQIPERPEATVPEVTMTAKPY